MKKRRLNRIILNTPFTPERADKEASDNEQKKVIKIVDINSIISIITLNVIALVCLCVCAQLCPILFKPHGLQPTRHLCPWNFPAKILEWIVFPSPGDLSDPVFKTASLVSTALAGDFFTTVPPGKP